MTEINGDTHVVSIFHDHPHAALDAMETAIGTVPTLDGYLRVKVSGRLA